jgi:DNA modification methylase
VAGGRRLAALRRNGTTTLRHGKEFVWRDEDVSDPGTALRLQAMELEENVRRSDLTWSETVLAKLKLLRTMQSIHGSSKGFGAGRTAICDKGFGIRTLAEMLNENPGTTSRDIELAGFVETNPYLATFPNRSDAIRHMGVAINTASKIKQAAAPLSTIINMFKPAKQAVSSTSTPSAHITPSASCTVVTATGNQASATPVPVVATQPTADVNQRWILYEGPFQQNIACVADDSVDLVLTDLPYNIALGTGNVTHGSGLSWFDDVDVDISNLVRDTAIEAYRVLCPNSFAVFFYGMAYHDVLVNALVDAKFTVDPYPFIWLRDRTAPPDGFARYSKSYDPALVASKGTPRFVRPNLPNTVNIPSVRGPQRLHAAQKPVDLMRKFIEDMTVPNSIVLDMFAGAGTTGVAALQYKRRCILFEQESANCLIIKSRLIVL